MTMTSSPLTISMNPQALARVLKNVMNTMFESAQSPQPMIPYLRIDVASPTDHSGGVLSAIGVGRYMAGTDRAETWSDARDRRASVTVLAKNPEKTDIVDDLWKLAMAVGKTSTARDAIVFVTIADHESISISYGEQLLGELEDMDPDGELDGDEESLGYFEEVSEAIREIHEAPETTKRLAYSVSLLRRIADVKGANGSDIADFKVHPEKDLVGVAIGPTYRAIYAGIDREGFASGGRWGDGDGSLECLIP